MKRTLATLIICSIVGLAFGQSNSFIEFKNKFDREDEITTVNLSGSLFKLMSEIVEGIETDPEIEELAKIAGSIDQVNIVSVPYSKQNLSKAIEELLSGLNKEKFDEVGSFRENGNKTQLYMLGSKRSIKSAVILIDESKEFTVLSIEGDLTYNDLSEFIKNMDHHH